MIRIKPDIAALRGFERKMAKDAALVRRISKGVAEEILGLIQEGFRQERDPSGQRWARKKRLDGRQVLVGKTGRLRRGWHTESIKRGTITIAPSVDYAGFHQEGTRRMVARKMVPDGVLPATWGTAMNQTVQEILKAHFG